MKRCCAVPAILLMLFAACKKVDTGVPMPPITHTGQDILACRINGKVMTAKGGKGISFFGSDAVYIYQGPMKYVIIDGKNTTSTGDEILLSFYYDRSNNIAPISLFHSDSTKGSYFNNFKSVNGLCYCFYTSTINGGALTIDYDDGIAISGRFAFDAVDSSNNIVHITDGQFDIARW
jgi:hypothetical protein